MRGGHYSISLIAPLFNLPFRIEFHTLTPIRPAHVADADEIGGRQTVEDTDFCSEQGRFSAKSHWPDAEFVRGIDDVLLEAIEFWIFVLIIQFAEKLLLRKFVTGGAIA